MQPKRWKMAIVIWIAIYPAVTCMFLLFGRQLSQIEPLPLRIFLLTGILVPLMIFILLPMLQKVFRNWLSR